MRANGERLSVGRREVIAGLAAAGAAVAGQANAQAPPPPNPNRWVHPGVKQVELWPGPGGYPWAASGIKQWTREAILRRVAPGRLICTWTTGGFSEPVDGNFTMIARSDDSGATWSAPEVLFRHAHRGLFTTELFVPRDGEVHAFLQTYSLGTWLTQIQSFRAVSRDAGRTWQGPHSIPGGIHNVWVNQGIVLASGRWVIPVSWAEQIGDEWCEPSAGRPPDEPRVGSRTPPQVVLPHGSDSQLIYKAANAWATRQHRYCVGAMLSDDGGQSFRLRGYLHNDDPRHFYEPKVVPLSDGSVAMLVREGKDGWLWRSDSADGGESWSPIRRSDIPNPSSKCRPLRARDGRIFLLNNPVGTDGKGGGRRSPLSLWISRDDMKTWETKVDLVADPSSNLNYPDGYIDEEAGEIHFAWEDAVRVYLMRVPMDVKPAR
ncbi:exo-alpha-sialidase [Paludisphaera rhizosphaerae]|uniref:exo-alpha-sialidase n=1 Tax=Paludisphaera rhizosphaerae TaxID=2711216 RepID=UPI0013EA8726|nr:sialidase family protein [Paludisphaera rhizosphaerae]